MDTTAAVQVREKFSNRRWYQCIPAAVISTVAMYFLFAFIGDNAGRLQEASEQPPPRKQSAGWIIIPTLITSVALTGGVFVWRTREANTNHALALFKDGTLVISGLQKAQFRPLPFSNGGWMIKQYPAAWQYRDRLQPITSNPKVLNLSIRITIKADHTDPNVVQGLIVQDWNTVAQEIKAGAYELFASELSQGQIGQLNPHRPQAVRGFRDFVRDNLTLPQGICAKNISVNQGGMTVS